MLEFRTLGTIDLRGEEGVRLDSVLLHAKMTALLAYLCASHPQPLHRRATVVALLWPEADEAHARGALRQQLLQLRRALGPGVILGEGEEAIGVYQERLWCDVWAFEEALKAGRLAEALDLWKGEFLPGVYVEGGEFQRWLDDTRDRLARKAKRAAGQLVAEAEAAGDLPRAVAAAWRLTDLTPYDETAWQTLIGLLDRSGDRAGALAAYTTLAARMRAELEVEPSHETRALMQRIRSRDQGIPPPAVIALLPVDNQTGDVRLDAVARRLTDQLARGISGPRFAHVTLGNLVSKANAIVAPAMYPSGGEVEVCVRIVEPGEAGRVVAVAEPVRIRADGSDAAPLDRLVTHVVVLLALHYDQRSTATGVAAVFNPPSLESYMEYLLGADLYGDQRYAEAAEHLRRAWEMDNGHVRAAVFGAIALAYEGQPATAHALLTAALAAGEPLPDYERNFGHWFLAFLNGDRANAYRSAMGVLKVTQHPVSRMIAGWAARNMNRPREMLKVLDMSVLGPGPGWWNKFTPMWDIMPGAYHALQDYWAELGMALSGRARFPESFNPLKAEIRARAGLGQPDEVLKLVVEALTLDSQPMGILPVQATPAYLAWNAAAELDAHGHPCAAARAREIAFRWIAGRTAPSRADRLLEARLCLESGDAKRAHRILEGVAPHEKDIESLGLMGLVAAGRGDAATARAVLSRLEGLQDVFLYGRHLLLAAGIRAALDEADTAVERLRDAFAAGLSFTADLHALPMLRPLAERRDFAELLAPRDSEPVP
jgi:DNA-binding SARP family transcriptional activator